MRHGQDMEDGKRLGLYRACQGDAGFTLVELLLALFLFALIAGVIFAAFAAVASGVEKGRQSLELYRVGRGALWQMAQEIAAQLAAFRDTGLTLDHINAHRHFHVHPVVAADFIRQAAQDGAKAVRVPFEPIEPLRRVEPTSLTWQQCVTAPWAGRLRERARRVGLQVPTATFGVRWSGQMTARRLTGLLRHLPDGLNEIYLHPATSNTFAGCTPGCHYSEEFAALVDREVIETVRRSGSAVGGYQDFLPV